MSGIAAVCTAHRDDGCPQAFERIVVDGGDAEQVATQVQPIRGVEMATVAAAFDPIGVAKATIEWIEDKKTGGEPVRPAETPRSAGSPIRREDSARS